MRVPTKLIDARNFDVEIDAIEAENAAAPFLGFDIETFDDAHKGILDFRKDDSTRVIFDPHRTTVAGFSTFAPNAPFSYYVNLNHADVENRLPWAKARRILDAKPKASPFVCHNKMFEITMMAESLKYDIGEAICTMQLAVSCFGPDEYDKDQFGKIASWEMINLLPQVIHNFRGFDKKNAYNMSPNQARILGQVVGKESKAAWSYNGFNKSISYSYGLKKLVRNLLFGEIGDFHELLEKFDAKDMRDLTGDQTADYGGDDSYWAVQLLYKLLTMIKPEALHAFETQENPMPEVFSDIWREGCRINKDAVDERFKLENSNLASQMEALKSSCQNSLPFSQEPNIELMEREPWYAKNWQKYRRWITNWDNDSKGKKPLNLLHYMPMRTMLYDLWGQPLVVEKSKVQSDSEARGRLLEKATGAAKDGINAIQQMAGINQRINLYLAPYQMLIDPATDKVYPVVSSTLATRRMAGQYPNTMQLAKQGESTYVRGFYLPDDEWDMNPFRRKMMQEYLDIGHSERDAWSWFMYNNGGREKYRHGLISIDLSQIELVIIGELSGDTAFKEAYGQLPYNDLHQTAGAAILAAVTGCSDFSREDFVELKKGNNRRGIELVDAKGQVLTASEAYKYNRGNAGGKGANFEFWFSGYLGTLAERRGLAGDAAQLLVSAYAQAFPEAVAWRQGLASDVMQTGSVILPDGHRRVRFEATYEWQALMGSYFRQLAEGLSHDDAHAVKTFGDLVIRKVSRRSVNQLINADIQGTCAAIIKRSILRIKERLHEFDARFMFPIHDELVFSCNWDHMWDFMKFGQGVMANHPDIIKNLVMNSSVSIGRTFQPWHPKRAPFGQIELSEAPELPHIPTEMIGGIMNEAAIRSTIEYLRPQ